MFLRLKTYTVNTFWKAKSHLLKCYQDRCGYSMIRVDECGGIKALEVDHFDPATKKLKRQPYRCFVLASRHCNGSKGNTWPSDDERKVGIYLINPREEHDYGRHLQVRESGELFGLTPAGKYQIRVCDLNAEHLCRLRRCAIEARQTLNSSAIVREGMDGEVPVLAEALRQLEMVARVFPYSESDLVHPD
ncbi:MAG: hypothetical protein KDN22_30250 [Verrucomicrobiae bacterium]|nr:hypothetical protein [Verrucomicrobiae bacterium]